MNGWVDGRMNSHLLYTVDTGYFHNDIDNDNNIFYSYAP